MLKVRKSDIKGYLKLKLATNESWAKRALLKIYDAQTNDEQATETTHLYNNVGFTGVDAKILSSMAKQLQYKKTLTERQMKIVFKKMPKYWSQIEDISDKDLLRTQVMKDLQNKQIKQLELSL